MFRLALQYRGYGWHLTLVALSYLCCCNGKWPKGGRVEAIAEARWEIRCC